MNAPPTIRKPAPIPVFARIGCAWVRVGWIQERKAA
jgi:hypothetical protein